MTIPLTSSQPGAQPTHKPYAKPIPATYARYQPTHPGLFRVVLGKSAKAQSGAQGEEGDAYDSCLVAEKDLPPHTVLTTLSNLSLAPAKAYSSVQFGPGEHDHFELNSDLLFVNHSCNPNVAFDITPPSPSSPPQTLPNGLPASSTTWSLRSLSRPIPAGTPLTFFYPSTEWRMDRGFQCSCGEGNCLGWIGGAEELDEDTLRKQEFVNEHIWGMKRAQRPGMEM